MNPLILLIACALAVYRLAELFVVDDGPFDIFFSLRGWLNRAPREAWSLRRTISNAFECVHCVGLWFAFIFGLLFASSLINYLLYSLAIAGLQSILANCFGRKQ